MTEIKVLTVNASLIFNLLVYLEAINEKKEFPGIQINDELEVYNEINERIKVTWNVMTNPEQFSSVGSISETIDNILSSIPKAKRNEVSHFFKAWWLEQPKHGFGYIMERLVFQLGRKELLRISGNKHKQIFLLFDDPPKNCRQQDERNFIFIPLYRFYPNMF